VALSVVSAAPNPQNQGAAARSVWEGVYSVEQAKRGGEQYAVFCTNCHQPDLQGDGMDVPGIADARFQKKWDRRSLKDLFEMMSKQMPEIAPGSLSRAVYTDLLAYILQVNGFPSGATPLDGEPDTLAGIAFEPFASSPPR
jgi:mono/diheme cytochrome c family protein